jgi:uncharacterized protein (DUF58 family)
VHFGVLQIVSQLALLLFLLYLPIGAFLYTDRFRHPPNAGQYATLFGAAVFAGAFLFLPALSIVFAMPLAAFLIAWLTGRYALTALTYERSCDTHRMFPGDETDLVVRLTNRKILPLAWVAIVDPIHYSVIRSTRDLQQLLHFSGGVHVQENLRNALVNRAALAPFQALVRTFRVQALQRGVYSLGPALVTSGDPFGLFPKSATMGDRLIITVYPRVYAPDDIDFPFREALGNLLARRALHEDPTLIAGSREYRYGDPLSRMHWKATARTGKLQVRLFDPSTTGQVMLVVNLNTFQHVWQGVDLDRMESAIEAAASIALWALEHDFSVGLRTNGIIVGTDLTPRLAPSANPRQSTAVLEQLARLSFSGQLTPESLLLDEANRLSAGASIVFITPVITPELSAVLTSRKIKGRVSVVYCGRHAAPLIRGVPVTLVGPPAEGLRAVS